MPHAYEWLLGWSTLLNKVGCVYCTGIWGFRQEAYGELGNRAYTGRVEGVRLGQVGPAKLSRFSSPNDVWWGEDQPDE